MNRFYRVSHYLGPQRFGARLGHAYRIPHHSPHSHGRVRFACYSPIQALTHGYAPRMDRAPLSSANRVAPQLMHAHTPYAVSGRWSGAAAAPAMSVHARHWTEKSRRALTAREFINEPVKRLLDVTVASVGLVLTLPLMVLCALAIRFESRGGVLYSQMRVGLDRRMRRGPSRNGSDRRARPGYGRPFKIYKFRSMVQEAERGTGPVWCSDRDPRITRVGQFLRRTHLDELPQLANVLRGEMSIVGPRPERPEFVEQLAAEIPGYRQRSAVLPGITGLAQVKYRYDRDLQTAATKLRYDLYYIRNNSPLLDVKIMAATIGVMARGEA